MGKMLHMRGRKRLLNGEDKQHISRRRHRAAVSAAVQPRYESDWDAVVEGKALLRKWECRTAELLPEAVSCALLCVSQRDCVGWFKVDGYCL